MPRKVKFDPEQEYSMITDDMLLAPHLVRQNAKWLLPRGLFVEIRMSLPNAKKKLISWHWNKNIPNTKLKPDMGRDTGLGYILYERFKT